MNKKTYWVYILHCENNSYYTGYTNDLVKRYQAHVDGTAKCKYTRSFKPLFIAQAWQILDTKAAAMRVENFIKQLSKEAKQKFILHPELLTQSFIDDVKIIVQTK